MGCDRWPGIPIYWTAHKGGSWGRSAPGVGVCVADLDWPPGFSTKSCDSREFCTTKHHHQRDGIFDQTPSPRTSSKQVPYVPSTGFALTVGNQLQPGKSPDSLRSPGASTAAPSSAALRPSGCDPPGPRCGSGLPLGPSGALFGGGRQFVRTELRNAPAPLPRVHLPNWRTPPAPTP